MKKSLIISFVFLLIGKWGISQTVQGTLLPGSAINRVIFAIKASAPFSASFSNVLFVLQIPNTVSPIPTVSIFNNPLSGFIPTASYNNSTVNSTTPIAFSNEGGYYNYLFSSVPTGQPPYNFLTTTTNVLEVQITGAPGTATVRFASLPSGGASTLHYFYIEAGGFDYTNEAAMFYGTGFSNGGSYLALSFVPLPNVSLPVTFTNYNVRCNDKGALLTWGTATEQNSLKFEIQRNTNGTNWITIDNVAAAGNSTTQRNYQYVDLYGGSAFYRIRQVDKDGKFIYTAVKHTDCKTSQFDVTLYPVPARDKLNVIIKSDIAVKTELQILDMSGRIMSRTVTQVNKGNNNIVLQVNDLPGGQYMLVSSDASIIINQKFTVIR